MTRIFTARRRRGMSIEAFQAYWREEHAALAVHMPGLLGYVQNHAVLHDGRTLLPYPGFDCLPELEFDDVEAMQRALDSPPHEQGVASDEDAFLESEGQGAIVAERELRRDGKPGEDAVKLMTFFRTHQRSSPEELRERLRGAYAEAAAQGEQLRHEQLFPVGRGTLPPASCDAVDLLWFGSPEAALQYLASAAADEATFQLAGRSFGCERVIVRPVRIV